MAGFTWCVPKIIYRRGCGLRAANGLPREGGYGNTPRALAPLVTALVLGTIGLGRLRVAAGKPANPTKLLYRKISVAINTGNAAKTQWAVGQMEALLKAGDHYGCPARLRWAWLPTLLAHHDYAAVAKLARLQILLAPGDTFNLWALQMDRTQALLFMGKAHAALRNAKILYDIVPTTQTAMAAKLLYRCLLAQKTDGRKLAREFRREQIAGSQPPTPGLKPKTCDVLAGIAVHAKPYVRCADRIVGLGLNALIARGNLWLLADRPNKALKCFKRAYDMATPKQLPMVCDRIAAGIRTKYGTIGPANAWLESIAK